MKQSQLFIERALIVAGAAIYLVVFNQHAPHGDALRIVRQIESGSLVWNPNHLVFDPLGYGFYQLVTKLPLDISPLGAFEFISAVATLGSLLLFHMILVRSGVTQPAMRVSAVAALFASASFVFVAVSQYYFMVQMPLLLAALLLYVDLLINSRAGVKRPRHVYAIGVLLALATAVMFNNLLLVAAIGIGVGLIHQSWRQFEWRHTLRLYSAAAAVGFPVFLAGYLASDTDYGLVSWLLSYEGNADSQLNEVFGIKLSISDVVRGALLIGYNLMVGWVIDPAGLGTVLRVVVFEEPLEFVPQWRNIGISVVAIPVVLLVNASVALFLLRRVRGEPAVRFVVLWILAFVLFNFLWKTGEEIFWFQIVPAVWFAFLLSSGAMSDMGPGSIGNSRRSWAVKQKAVWLGLIAVMLLIVNTSNAVAPGAARDFYEKQIRHAELLRDGDLEILPGWDGQKWMMLPDNAPMVERLVLMNLAVAALGAEEQILDVPRLVQSHLDRGGRVIVARVFDLDNDLTPWYRLHDIGWSRSRLKSLFDGFCNRPIAVIGGVTFREIVHCDHGSTAPGEDLSLISSTARANDGRSVL